MPPPIRQIFDEALTADHDIGWQRVSLVSVAIGPPALASRSPSVVQGLSRPADLACRPLGGCRAAIAAHCLQAAPAPCSARHPPESACRAYSANTHGGDRRDRRSRGRRPICTRDLGRHWHGRATPSQVRRVVFGRGRQGLGNIESRLRQIAAGRGCSSRPALPGAGGAIIAASKCEPREMDQRIWTK